VARHEDIARARETVAVIGGTGALGFGLAVRWAIAGTPILIGSRDAGRAGESAARATERAKEGGASDPRVEGLTNEDAAAGASTVVLAVPFRAQAENLGNLRNALQPQTILVDATVPLAAAIGGRATRTLAVWQGSAAQQAAEMVPRGVSVVSGLHTVSAAALADPSIAMDEDVLLRATTARRRTTSPTSSAASPACARSTAAISRWPGSSSRSRRC